MSYDQRPARPLIGGAVPPLPGVLRRLLDRRRLRAAGDNSRAGHDGRKIGLVVQGGCMRGVFTAGALCGLESLGLRGCFDAVYGSSGGAINAAYFLGGQVAYGTSIYYTDINNRTFIDFARLPRGTAVDIDYCIDEIVGGRKRLHTTPILAGTTRFTIYLTDPESCAPVAVDTRAMKDGNELLAALKGSAAMPLVFRRPALYRGKRYLDGAFLTPVPLLEALADGCTDVLVLLSRPLATDPPGMAGWLKPWVLRSVRRPVAPLEVAWERGQERHRQTLALLRRPASIRGGDPIELACVAPPGDFRVTRWTRSRALLIEAAIEGARRVHEMAGVPAGVLDPAEAIRVRSGASDSAARGDRQSPAPESTGSWQEA